MDLAAAETATGIESGRIRYFEKEFREFLSVPAGIAAEDEFDARTLALLSRIHLWMFTEGMSPFEVRQRLSSPDAAAGGGMRVIAVTSGKGGVGKTTVALNLSMALAARGQRTLLVDADMGLGNVHVLAGVQPRGTVLDVVERRAAIEDILAEGPAGVKILCGASGVAELADLSVAKLEHMLEGLGRLSARFDIAVVDTAAGIASQVTRFLRVADDIVVVTTPNIAATLDAYGVMKVAHEGNMRGRLHVLVNMAMSNRQADAVYERLRDCARRFLHTGPGRLGSLQKHGSVERANQSRRPLLEEAPDGVNAVRFGRMAEALLATARPAAGAAADAPPGGSEDGTEAA
jgi:flagellar biosynthesis protein FlhG